MHDWHFRRLSAQAAYFFEENVVGNVRRPLEGTSFDEVREDGVKARSMTIEKVLCSALVPEGGSLRRIAKQRGWMATEHRRRRLENQATHVDSDPPLVFVDVGLRCGRRGSW